VVLDNRLPALERIFRDVGALGVYLHIPFCDQICPYCPYNKELYQRETAIRYAGAVKKEIDRYAELIGEKPVTSFYIGGGTPTTMLNSGLRDILEHLFKRLNMKCDIHMESHPNHLSPENLDSIESMGVKQLSVGIEALQDRHLQTLNRPYTVDQAMAAVSRAVHRDFDCVNADIIFALPNQTCADVEETGRALVGMSLDQVAAYPLFVFPYTRMGKSPATKRYGNSSIIKRRKMLGTLERVFYKAGFERTSAWAFTKRGIPKYCSVTVPLYVGLGASGGTYLNDVFYINTFRVADYIDALENGRWPIALSLELSERMQMAGWLYWRIYETRFMKSDFVSRFGKDFDSIFGRYARYLSSLGFLDDEGGRIVLSDRGTFWLHALEDLFSINYIGTLWGGSMREPWPEKVEL